ncbi:MAG TPA: methylated-DNA--[protein]-cysteine S-methyltransferase [Candidatus Saccharimonadales bacterium]|nr:methylated-DNA--[protein]-cysteine S-methyltransferase [Candidatus Saccharimonadales bacterium]
MILDFAVFRSPIGPLELFATDRGLCGVELPGTTHSVRKRLARRFGKFETRTAPDPARAVSSLKAYFGGRLDALDEVTTDPGGTPFERRVWAALRAIPAGKTTTYAKLAERIGAPGSARAVGGANARNPVAVVVPCHRVVAAGGGLGGYAGGLKRKRWLLDHEAGG